MDFKNTELSTKIRLNRPAQGNIKQEVLECLKMLEDA